MFVMLVASLGSGCGHCYFAPGAKEFREVVNSISSSNASAMSRFSDLSYEKQIDVFFYARRCRNDPRVEPMLTLDGGKKLDAIISRIKIEKDARDKQALVTVLMRINRDCLCIKKDSRPMWELKAVGHEIESRRTDVSDRTSVQGFLQAVDLLNNQINEQ